MGAPDERDPALPRFLVRKGIAVKEWKMEQARARLSDVIKAARQHGPQCIKLRGKPVAVVLSKEDFDRLGGGHQGRPAFVAASPLAQAAVEVELPPRMMGPPKKEGL